jgi:hypothetical protein
MYGEVRKAESYWKEQTAQKQQSLNKRKKNSETEDGKERLGTLLPFNIKDTESLLKLYLRMSHIISFPFSLKKFRIDKANQS